MRFVGGLVLAVGCGGGAGGGPFELEVEAAGASLVVVQDGDAAFRPLELDPSGVGRFEVTAGFYGVGALCHADVGSQHSQFNFDTEARRHVLSCGGNVDHVMLSGTTAPGADVFVGQDFGTAEANGAYTQFVVPGTYDAFALVHDPVPRMFVARDIDLTADRVVDLPVTSEGVDLVAVTPTVTGAAASEVTLGADLNTTSTYIFFDLGATTTVHVPPQSILVASDRPTIAANAKGCMVQHPLSLLAPAFAIPTPLAATIDRSTLSWTADTSEAWEQLRLELHDMPLRKSSVLSFATAGWLAAAGGGDAFPIVDITTLDGWTPELGGFTAGQMLEFSAALSHGRYDGDLVWCEQDGKFTW